MGETLYVTLTKEDSTVQEEYWWPLVFEAMHRAGFQFVDPRSETKQGTYFSFTEAMDYVSCTFQELWKALYVKRDVILVLFWPSNEVDPFDIGVNVRKESNQTNGHWQLELSLEDGYLGNDDMELDRIRVAALLRASLALYDLCFPCSIKIFWSEDETDLSQMRIGKQEEPLESMVFYGQTLHWKKLASYAEQDLFIVDPLPIHLWGKKFRFISLPSALSYDE